MKTRRSDRLTRSLNGETTRRGFLGLAAIAAGIAVSRPAVLAADDRPEQKRLAPKSVLERGIAWLQAKQLPNGAFPNKYGEPDFGPTFEAISASVALRNVGVDGGVDIDAAVAFLEENAAVLNEALVGGESNLVIPLVAAGADPRNFGGENLVDRLAARWDAAAGLYDSDPLANALALLALAGAGEEIPGEAIAALAAAQIVDGSWPYTGGLGNLTGTLLVVQVLAVAGRRNDPMVDDAIAYVQSVRDAGGAFGFSPGAPPDTLTTAFVVMALSAAGERRTGETWKPTIDALIAFQQEGGAFRYTDFEPEDDLQATCMALLALAGGSLPVLPTA